MLKNIYLYIVEIMQCTMKTRPRTIKTVFMPNFLITRNTDVCSLLVRINQRIKAIIDLTQHNVP